MLEEDEEYKPDKETENEIIEKKEEKEKDKKD